VPQALGQGATALAGDFDEAVVVGDLLQKGQGALGFRQFALVQVGFKLQERVVDTQAIILDAALQEIDEFLLAGEAFGEQGEGASGGGAGASEWPTAVRP
jgi:hypothetical protein